jgi:hypothetical protein
MIIGAHSIIYSTDPEADRAFLRDVLGLPNVDVGDAGLHPPRWRSSSKRTTCEFYFMCSDIDALIAAMRKRGVKCATVQDQGWGMLTQVTLPGGGKLGVYQPRHARPKSMSVKKARKPARRRQTSKSSPTRA